MTEFKQLQGSARTQEFEPKVTLISLITAPVGTIGSIWYGSRMNDSLNPEPLERIYQESATLHDFESASKLIKAFPQYASSDPDVDVFSSARECLINIAKVCFKADLPVSESLAFTLQVDDANVAWREQLVRSKHSSYFMQTSRIADLSKMDVNRSKNIELIAGKQGVQIYDDAVNALRKAYYKLGELGVPQEDIRLQPQMNIHRVYWMTSMRAILKTLNNRNGWIAQSTLWSPIIAGICKEFRRLGLWPVVEDFVANPPVGIAYDTDYDKWYISDYKLQADNEDRILGKDPLPVDPLYLAYKFQSMPSHTNIKHYDYLKSLYIHTWNDKYLSVLGWNREDPDQLGPYDRPKDFFNRATSKDLHIEDDNKAKEVIKAALSLK
jgi:hypothetical protein